MKTLTVKQLWAYLICSGVKDIENRTWPTKFRGRMLIHASARPTVESVMSIWEKFSIIREEFFEKNDLQNSAIIGSVEIVDCVHNHESVWAEKDYYNWVLKNPVLFEKPIENIKGKLSFWEFTDEIMLPNQ